MRSQFQYFIQYFVTPFFFNTRRAIAQKKRTITSLVVETRISSTLNNCLMSSGGLLMNQQDNILIASQTSQTIRDLVSFSKEMLDPNLPIILKELSNASNQLESLQSTHSGAKKTRDCYSFNLLECYVGNSFIKRVVGQQGSDLEEMVV